jgi:hypothetical protein
MSLREKEVLLEVSNSGMLVETESGRHRFYSLTPEEIVKLGLEQRVVIAKPRENPFFPLLRAVQDLP